MSSQKSIDRFKTHLEDYLSNIAGINTRSLIRCINPDHEDRNPSMSYDKKRMKLHCFSCKANYDLFQVIGIYEGVTDFKDQLKRANELYGDGQPIATKHNRPRPDEQTEEGTEPKLTQAEIEAVINAAHGQAHLTEYFSTRGISEATIKRYKLGYEPQTNRVIIPMQNSQTKQFYYMSRSAEPNKKDWRKLKQTAPLLNEHHLINAEPQSVIWITEGAFDAFSLEEANPHIKVIALNGANNSRLYELIKQYNTNAYFIIATDNDQAGSAAALTIQDELAKLNLFSTFYKFQSAKDLNELYTNAKDQFLYAIPKAEQRLKGEIMMKEAQHMEQLEHNLERERAEYMRTNAARFIETDFLEAIKNSRNAVEIPTNFKKLDEVLEGGLYEGLYIIGAISSLGKTSFILQIADQIAQQGHDILYFSLEMSRAELVAKSISRLTTEAPNRYHSKTVRGILNGKRHENYSDAEAQVIDEAINKYRSYADHIYLHEGIGNIGAERIKNEVDKHKRITGRTPVVIIDYLQILAPYDIRATDKQNTDKAVLELKRLSRDYKLPVIAISSFNRSSYNQSVSMEAFKESGAIEYSSDVLLGLQFKGMSDEEKTKTNIDALKSKDIREIELKILKNRNGKTGQKIEFEYIPAFNKFIEC